MTTHTLEPGTLLQGRYRVEEAVGRGGMGAVYRAQDTRLDTTVAVKELLEQPGTPDQRELAVMQFKREARFLGQLSHPNLPKVTDYFVDDGRCYLVMEFIHGRTLEAVLRSNEGRALPLRQVLEWAMQLADVLHYLHSQDPPIVFRDLKPANIMLTEGGTIKLIDFGIARRFDVAATKDTLLYGSPGYSPPEQYGHSQTDPRADLYAFGATLHHLLTGRDPAPTPFKFPSTRSYNPQVPPELDEFILRCVRMDPAERIHSAAEALQILRNIYARLATFRPEPVKMHQTRRPARITVTVIVVALVAAGLGVAAMLRNRKTEPLPAATHAAAVRSEGSQPVSTGSIQIASAPAGAAVYIDGQPMGTTPALIPQVAAGSHNVHLVPPAGSGLADWWANVDVKPGATTPIVATLPSGSPGSPTLPPVRAHATARLVAEPPDSSQAAAPGIEMDASFQITGIAGKSGSIALFLFGADGVTPLKPADPQSPFQNSRGQLSVAQSFQATSDPYQEENIRLFIPLSEVPVPPEQVTWQMVVFVGDQPVFLTPVQPLGLH
ncbi:MAG: serine/threonine protein kinase [Chthonomonadales bacterium]